MNCIHCGAEISERQEICTLCGKYARVPDKKPVDPEPSSDPTPVKTSESADLSTQTAYPEKTSTTTVEKPGYGGVSFCTECNELVYLNDQGGCERGHPASAIKDQNDRLGGLTPEQYFDKVMGTDNTSGKGSYGQLPAELRGWNWGAFFFTWIWGIGNSTRIAFLSLVPYVGFVMPFVLGFKGNEWAWRNKKWNSIAHFKQIQKNWAIAGVIYTIVITVLIVLFLIMIFSMAGTSTVTTTALPK